jgi:hypothetical protein
VIRNESDSLDALLGQWARPFITVSLGSSESDGKGKVLEDNERSRWPNLAMSLDDPKNKGEEAVGRVGSH